MPGRRAILEAVHLAILSMWLGAMVMAGATAVLVFGQIRELDPKLPGYKAYEGSHASLLAGKVANRVFTAVDIIQLACAIAVVASLIAITAKFRDAYWRLALVVRWLTIVCVLGCLGYNLVVLSPRMGRNAAAYWSSAQKGDNAAATAFHAAFEADHPTASRVLALTAVAVLLS